LPACSGATEEFGDKLTTVRGDARVNPPFVPPPFCLLNKASIASESWNPEGAADVSSMERRRVEIVALIRDAMSRKEK
jgi:hypothetical protein